MKRRMFCAAAASALGAGPASPVRAQAGGRRRVGLLSFVSDPTPGLPAVERGLARFLRPRGWIEGENLVTERAFADFRGERLPAMAQRLLANGADLIYTFQDEATIAAARATSTVPIVFFGVTWPVEQGLVHSFARPGRNVTGVSYYTGIELTLKRVQLLREMVPDARRMWWMWPSAFEETVAGGRHDMLTPTRAAASQAGFESNFFDVRSPEDFDAGLAAAVAAQAQVLQVAGTSITARQRQIADFGLRHRLPIATPWPPLVDTGALLGIGPTDAEQQAMGLRANDMVDRILRGTAPSDIPVERPSRYEVVLNLRTAKALDLVVPPALRLRADRVLE